MSDAGPRPSAADAAKPTSAHAAEVAPAVAVRQAADADAIAGVSPPVLPKRTALGATFVKGMVWSTLALIISKFSSLLATVAIAWKFGQGEYGAFLSARGSAILGDVLTDGGMRRVLITRGAADYDQIARASFRISLGFNLVGCALMCGTASFVHQPGVAPQLLVTALAMLLATFGSVQRARLALDLRFARAAYMYTISAVLRNVLTVAFAFAGLGPLSFALPVVFVALWEAFYARFIIGPLPVPPGGRVPWSLTRELIGQGKWVIFAMIGSSLVARGDYLMAQFFFHPHEVAAADGQTRTINIAGQYMFAFQLTIGLFSPLTIGLATVIQPVMAQLRKEIDRQADAFRRMVRIAVYLAVPASLVSVGLTPLLIHSIKHGYWDETAVAIQILAATECVRQLYQMSTATLEASGRFRTSAIVVILDGVLTVIAALIGCMIGSLLALTIAVAIERTLTAIAEALYTDHLAGGSPWKMLRQIVPPLLVGATIAVLLGGGVRLLAHDVNAYRWLLAGAGILAIPAFFGLSVLITPGRVRETWDLVATRLRRRAAN